MSDRRRSTLMSGLSIPPLALLPLALTLWGPVPALADQTLDQNHPAFADAVVVPLDDSFLDITAIVGTMQFTITVDSVPFTFTSTSPFSSIDIGPGGMGGPVVLTSPAPISVTVGGPVQALGFVLLFGEGPPSGLYQGTLGAETVTYPFQGENFFGGAFGIGNITSALVSPDPASLSAVWRGLRFVPSSEIACALDSECPIGELCSPTTNTCVAGTPCSSDLECGSGELCSATNQVCVAGTTCFVNADCATGELCSVTNNACVPGTTCSGQADCATGEFCSASNQVCVPGLDPCLVNADCPSGELCSIPDNVCTSGIACTSNIDCGAGTVCSATNDVCVPGGSSCLLNGDCQVGELCSIADQVCVPATGCASDADCSADTFCSATNFVCLSATGPCFLNTDCPSGELCSIPDNQCVAGVACGSDSDCAAGTFCSGNGVCAPGAGSCTADTDCISGELCSTTDQVCVPGTPCVGDADCGNGTTCSPDNGVCVSSGATCSANTDCAPFLQICADAGICEDPRLASGLDSLDLELLTPDGGPPTVGQLFGARLFVPIGRDELQLADVSLTLANPFQIELEPPTFPELGLLEAERADGTLVFAAQLVVLDLEVPSIFVDLDGDLEFDLAEPVVLVREGSVLIDVSLPFGGDYDPDEHFFLFDGGLTVTLEPIFSVAAPSHPNIRVVATSVDPDTGGPNDGIGVSPRIVLRDYTLDVDLAIDVKPGSFPNSINPRSKGVIPVAILSTDSFSAASDLDPSKARFGPDGAAPAHGPGHVEDVDGDGDYDLLLHFPTRRTGIECSDTEAVLTAETSSGETFQGSDSIRTVGCKARGHKPRRFGNRHRWPWWHPRRWW